MYGDVEMELVATRCGVLLGGDVLVVVEWWYIDNIQVFGVATLLISWDVGHKGGYDSIRCVPKRGSI